MYEKQKIKVKVNDVLIFNFSYADEIKLIANDVEKIKKM